MHCKYIPKYIQQDVALHNLFISGNRSTCFGWYFHPSSGAYTTVSTASGICHTVTATCRYRGRVGNRFECAVCGVRHPQHTNNTENDTKQTLHRTTQKYIEQHKNYERVRAVPRLCAFYPGICLIIEEKAWKNLGVVIHAPDDGRGDARNVLSHT